MQSTRAQLPPVRTRGTFPPSRLGGGVSWDSMAQL
jgi:hypothetical protein